MTQPNPQPAPLSVEEVAARTKLASRLRKLHAESGAVEWIYDGNSNLDSSTVLFYDESEDEYRDVCQVPCQAAASDHGFDLAVNPAVGEFIAEPHNGIIDLLDERDALLATLDAHQQENQQLKAALRAIASTEAGYGDTVLSLIQNVAAETYICEEAEVEGARVLLAALTPPQAGAKEEV